MKGKYGYYSYSSGRSYNIIRRRRAIRNIIVITCLMILMIAIVGFLSTKVSIGVTEGSKIDIAVSKLKDAVKTYNENKIIENDDITHGCVDGRKIIIIEGVTYYAGNVDTWGDVKTIKCEGE
jgi:hypothetical protein